MGLHSYKNYLQSEYWQEVKRMVRMRDRFTCRDCGKRKLVQVHHLTYAHKGHEKQHLEDLICLCPQCHKKRHGLIKKSITMPGIEKKYKVTFRDGHIKTMSVKENPDKVMRPEDLKGFFLSGLQNEK